MQTPTQATVVIKKSGTYSYDVLYDNVVLVGKITKNNRRFIFYPEDLDGVNYNALIIIAKKISELERLTFGN